MNDAPEAASIAPKAASPIAARIELASLAVVPPLTLVAAIAVLFDLVVRRGFLRTGSSFADRPTLLALEPYGRFVATLTGLSALLALAFAIAPLVLRNDLLTLARRAGLALFTSLFLPSLLTATFLPIARTTPPMVLVGTIAADVLSLSLALVAFEWRAPAGIRITCAMSALAALGAFTAVALALVGPLYGWAPSYAIASAARDAGEIAFLITPIVLSATFLSEARGRTLPLRIATSVGLIVFGAVAFVLARAALGPDYETVLYGALRLSTFVHASSLPYALALGMTLGTAFFGLSSPSPVDRQLGAGVLLFFGAGYGPRSPAQLVVMVLATSLFARAVIAAALKAREERERG